MSNENNVSTETIDNVNISNEIDNSINIDQVDKPTSTPNIISTPTQNTKSNSNTNNNHNSNINRNFKGIWIPKDIYLNDNLSWTEKILLIEIDSLDDEINGCFATNEYFAKFLNVTERSITSAIKKLKELNFIELISFNNKKRILKIVKNININSNINQNVNTNNTNSNTNSTNSNNYQNTNLKSDLTLENSAENQMVEDNCYHTDKVEESFHLGWKETSTLGGRNLLPSNIYINNTTNKTLNKENSKNFYKKEITNKSKSFNNFISQENNSQQMKQSTTQNITQKTETQQSTDLTKQQQITFDSSVLDFEDNNSDICKYVETEFAKYYGQSVYNIWIKANMKIVKDINNANTNNTQQDSIILLASVNGFVTDYVKQNYLHGIKKRRGITSDLDEDTYWFRKGLKELFQEYNPNIKDVIIKPLKEIEAEFLRNQEQQETQNASTANNNSTNNQGINHE